MFEQSKGEAIARVYSPEDKGLKAVTRRNKEEEMNAVTSREHSSRGPAVQMKQTEPLSALK